MDWTPNMPHFWSKLSMTPQGSIRPFVSEVDTFYYSDDLNIILL
jgi:hypothetical protein